MILPVARFQVKQNICVAENQNLIFRKIHFLQSKRFLELSGFCLYSRCQLPKDLLIWNLYGLGEKKLEKSEGEEGDYQLVNLLNKIK